MKRIRNLFGIFVMQLLLSGSAYAALVDMNDGTVYDTGTQLTWLKNANQNNFPGTWANATNWVTVTLNGGSYAGFNDWRLPTADGSCFNTSLCDTPTNEMGHLYVELGNTGSLPIKMGPFTNIQAANYWSSTPVLPEVYAFNWSNGFTTDPLSTDTSTYAWAVRSGARTTYAVTANAAGNGYGTVTSDVGGVDYYYQTTNTGVATVPPTTNVVLTAGANVGSTVAWNDCVANGGVAGGTATLATCTFSDLSEDKTATATFTYTQYTVATSATGSGSGTVSSNVGGISYSYPATNAGTSGLINPATYVALTATASGGSTVAWTTCTGATAGNGTTSATCTYPSLDGNKTAAATFTADPAAVGVAVPTMTEWGMIFFMALAGLGSIYHLRRRRRA
jgi:hypothetical protein